MSAPIPTSWKTIRDTLKRVITDAAVTQITSAGGVTLISSDRMKSK